MPDASHSWIECDWHRHYRVHAHGENAIGPCDCAESICWTAWLFVAAISVLWLGVTYFRW